VTKSHVTPPHLFAGHHDNRPDADTNVTHASALSKVLPRRLVRDRMQHYRAGLLPDSLLASRSLKYRSAIWERPEQTVADLAARCRMCKVSYHVSCQWDTTLLFLLTDLGSYILHPQHPDDATPEVRCISADTNSRHSDMVPFACIWELDDLDTGLPLYGMFAALCAASHPCNHNIRTASELSLIQHCL
jgi:hypothetical protein